MKNQSPKNSSIASSYFRFDKKSTAPETPISSSRIDLNHRTPTCRQTIYSTLNEVSSFIANHNIQRQSIKYLKPVLADRVRNFKNRQQKSSYNIIQNREFQTPQNADKDLEQLKLNPSKSTCIIKFTKPVRTALCNQSTLNQIEPIPEYKNAVISGLSKKLVFDETEYLKTPDIKRQSSQAPKGKRISLLSRTDSMTQLLRGDKKISPVREVSTEREMRIHRYTDSSLMRETINEYRDNDKTFGVVNTKSVTRDKININVDFQVCRQNLWKIIPSPMKYTVGNQTHYLQ